jgi:hypothetical protein
MRHGLPEIYDDRPLRGPRPPRRWPIVLSGVALIVLVAAAWFFLLPRLEPQPPTDTAPVRVVRGRPLTQGEAARLLRRHLGPDECVVVMGKGSAGNTFLFTAVNRCEGTRLGQWKVDAKTQTVSRNFKK